MEQNSKQQQQHHHPMYVWRTLYTPLEAISQCCISHTPTVSLPCRSVIFITTWFEVLLYTTRETHTQRERDVLVKLVVKIVLDTQTVTSCTTPVNHLYEVMYLPVLHFNMYKTCRNNLYTCTRRQSNIHLTVTTELWPVSCFNAYPNDRSTPCSWPQWWGIYMPDPNDESATYTISVKITQSCASVICLDAGPYPPSDNRAKWLTHIGRSYGGFRRTRYGHHSRFSSAQWNRRDCN